VKTISAIEIYVHANKLIREEDKSIIDKPVSVQRFDAQLSASTARSTEPAQEKARNFTH
jgi:hypothetical protein